MGCAALDRLLPQGLESGALHEVNASLPVSGASAADWITGFGFALRLAVRRALVLPADEAKVVRGLGPLLANVAGAGVALLWITGLIMVWSKWDGIGSLPTLFWVKFVFVLSLTVVTGLIHMTYAEIRKGNVALAARLPRLGPMAGVSALLAVLFAVLAFN